jgi:FimV-like protein
MCLQIFKLVAAFLLLANCSLWSAYSLALSLGEIKLDSALGQPLRATIQIVDHAIDSNSFTADLYRGDNLGNTSSEDDLYLNSLSFRFADDDEGANNLLIIASEEIFQRPELDFFVELTWPDKSVLVRVTLLFLDQSESAVAQIVEFTSSILPYKVIVGDTLWSIASRLSSEDVSIWQAMDGMFSANPSAFLGGDPSKVIVGSYLFRPSDSHIGGQSGFVVADQLGLDVYNEALNMAVIDDGSEGAASRESLDLGYSNQEIPYFEVTDSLVVNDSVYKIAGQDVVAPVVEAEVTENLLDVVLLSLAEPIVVEQIDVARSIDEALVNAQQTAAKAQSEISDLRKIIISLNSEISNLQGSIRLQKIEENNAIAEALLEAKSDYLMGQLNGTQLITLIGSLVVAIGLFVYFAIKRTSGMRESIAVSRQGAKEIEDADLDDGKIIPTQASSGGDIFDESYPQPKDVFAREYETDGDIQRSASIIDNISFDEELDSESVANLDYLDMTENIDPVDVKLDLAETYADLGDISGAREILEEIISESNKEGKRRATAVLDKLNSDASR